MAPVLCWMTLEGWAIVMPPSSGGLLSVSHSDRQTVAHAQPYRYIQAHTVCTPYTLYTQGQVYMCKQKHAKMHNKCLWICKHIMLKEQQDCQLARRHAVTFLMTHNVLYKQWQHGPLNFRLLQSCWIAWHSVQHVEILLHGRSAQTNLKLNDNHLLKNVPAAQKWLSNNLCTAE